MEEGGGVGQRDDYPGKRLLDLALATVALALLSPLLLLVGVATRLSSPGPALHRARRVGRDGEPFELLKFRSMRIGSASAGPGITARGDSRVTSLGRLLRSTKIDELPQLANVLRGQMSIVGPRPEDPRYVAWYTEEQRAILRYRPGITSPASLRYRDEEAILAGADDLDAAYRTVMGHKIAIDLAYFADQSLVGDLRVIGSTVRSTIRRGTR
jgi:lipopolysaccharide/colanic/teichoic acid biosynthesis glycosyltransferase